jgi:MFS transporter, DHA2 family, multidrug resistance protein
MAGTSVLKPAPANLAADHVTLKTWISIAGVLLGAFMAILDIQITNACLKDIQGALGATLEEGSWISTAYVVAEVVVIPITGYLSQVFSVRWYLLVNTALFLVFSICCACAWNLPSMIVFRALQGFAGGVLIPLCFTVILTTLPPAKQPTGMALFAIASSFGPGIGPTLGGWLTDNYGWKYIFYVNVIPVLLMMSAVWSTVKAQPIHIHLLKKGDWPGILSMAIGLGALQIVLEEGNREDWFGSELIVKLIIIAIVFLILFLWIEFTQKQPFINLRLLGRRNFGLAIFVNTLLGTGLYGSVYILPLFLTQVKGYSAMQIGEVVAWYGLSQLFIIPFVPKLMRHFDTRLIVAVGIILFSMSCFTNSTMSHDTGIDQLLWSQLVRAVGQPLIVVPISSIATARIEKAQVSSASALFSMMRNMGGSIGIAALSTLLIQREQFHSERIGESISMYNLRTQQRLEQMTQFFMNKGADLNQAHAQSLAAISNIVRREAYVMAYNDCFYIMACALLLSGIAILFMKRSNASSGEKSR